MQILRRLAVQTGAIISALLVATVAVFSVFDAMRETQLARDDIYHQLSVVAHNVATLSTSPLLLEDFATVEMLLLEIAKLPQVSRITLTDLHGVVLTEAKASHGETQIVYDAASDAPPSTPREQRRDEGRRSTVWHPIHEQHLLGWVRLEGDLSSLDAIQRRIWRQALRNGVAVVLASVLLMMLFLRPQLLAIKRVTRFAAALPTARGSQMPPERSTIELEMLVDALNGAARRLFEQERSLRESEERYRTLFEESRDVIFFDTPDDRLIDINPAGVALFGFSSQYEMLAANLATAIYASPAERQRLKTALIEQGYVKDFDVRMKNRDGKEVVALVTATVVTGEDGTPQLFRGILRDVTAQRQLEAQLRHAQRMEAVGRLTGGIAHDFNNILTAIMGYASLLQVQLADRAPLAEGIAQILAAGRRAAELTQSLLTFSRKQLIDTRVVDLNDVVGGIGSLVRGTLGERITTEIELCAESLAVIADVGQIEQVLVNLATNARDAMPSGGTLHIATAAIDLDDAFVHAHGYGRVGHFAQLVVSDTGCGMDSATQARIFEPFFTTKEVGRGTGLGLSTVYGIVKRHDGYINVYSEPGHGTVFRIYLPRTEQKAEPAAASVAASATPVTSGGGETILVVEDDPAVRAMLAATLTQHGYEVLLAEDGLTAERVIEAHLPRINLLLIDIILPHKNGREVLNLARRMSPHVPALFVSGYTSDIIARQNLRDPHTELLLKPVLPNMLLAKVRALLDAETQRRT